jgi:hypothetical protein
MDIMPSSIVLLARSAIPDSVLPLDAMIDAECLKLPRHVLPTLVITQCAQSLTSDVLSPSLELLESSKCFRLVPQEINSLEARMIINEGDPKPISLVRGYLHWTMHIAVNKLERPGSSELGGWEGICMHLASFTGFTYQIRIGLRIKLETRH